MNKEDDKEIEDMELKPGGGKVSVEGRVIKPCPCGATPKHLCIAEGSTCKWAFVSGECCGEWQVEFRTEYRDLASDEVTALALKAWNETPRAL
ncbi:hypothetical protein KAR91_36225 [Candidatus Pacearchaeota archaeon]|nr:hypothetical protein [Candidatus Pacearchaeota archaeon]